VIVGNGSRMTVVLVDGDNELATWRLDCPEPPDLSAVETLARLQLAALRLGCSIRLEDPCMELCELLELVGLVDLVPDADSDAADSDAADLLLEASREAEGGEQAGVDEGVDSGDPFA